MCIHNNAKTKQVSQHLIQDSQRARINPAAQIKNGQTAHFYHLAIKNRILERNLTIAFVPTSYHLLHNPRTITQGALLRKVQRTDIGCLISPTS